MGENTLKQTTSLFSSIFPNSVTELHYIGGGKLWILYSYFMSVCSIEKTITLRYRGWSDALLHGAEGFTKYNTTFYGVRTV